MSSAPLFNRDVKMVVVMYEWSYPGDSRVIKINNLDKAEFKKYADELRRCIAIILRFKPCHCSLHFIFAKQANVDVFSASMARMVTVNNPISQADISKTNFPGIDTLPLMLDQK